MTVAKFRVLCLSITAVLLCGGYAASQWFSLSGRAAEWTRVIDVPTVQALSAVLLISLVAIGVADKGEPA